MFINKEIAQLIILQRIDLSGFFLQKLRKLLGRRFFTSIASKYIISPKTVGKKYIATMNKEYENISKFLNFDGEEILSIGSGLCGLELIINENHSVKKFTIIEKNYISKKVVYGWDNSNSEAYNNLELVKLFLKNNGMDENRFEVFDFDKNTLPTNNFDAIISLYSLDYHYDFTFYLEYFKKVFKKDTKIIFDTIRPEYFENLFDKVEIIDTKEKTVHRSKRIICEGLILKNDN